MKRKTIAVLLALVLLLSMSMTALADSSTTATVPVTLTVDNEYRAVNITVPASLPIHIINGTVVVADSAKIVNNSKLSAVRVAGITVADGAYKVGSYDSFSGSQTIALKINGCPTTGPGKLTINATAFPDLAPGGVLPLMYYAKISGDAKNVENLEAASVIITFAFVDEEDICMNNRRERSKRTLSVLLALVLVLTALPTLAWADEGNDGHVHAEDYGDGLDVEVGPQAEDASPSGAAPNTYEEKQWLWEHPVSGSLIWHTDIFGGLHIGGWESIPSFNSADDQPWRSIDRASITSVYFDYDEQPEIESLDHWFDGFINLADDCIFDPASCAIISSVSPIASDRCNITGCTCATCGFYYYDYKPDPIDEENAHICDVHCDGCSASGGIWVTRSHTFSGNRCTLCGYTKSCSHLSTSRTWTTGCDYKDICTSCGAVVRTGTSHGPYSYGSWSYYSSSQHRRTQSCDYGDWSGYEYASHSTTTSYGQYSSTQHSVRSYCSECGSYIGSTSYSSHSFSYGSWTNYSSTQHRRTKTCSTCGYSEYEYKSHSLSYGSWTSTGSSQHKRTASCSCGYSTTETAAHTLTRTAWTSDGAAQHKRTASCGTCGYSTTERKAHSLTDGAWASISDTQHQRTTSCSCGYSTTETTSHSLTYGKWTQHNAPQHKRTKSCFCGYSGTEYAADTLVPGRWASVSDTQHSRTNACECGHTTTETASHADSDGDGNCDSCQYLMTRFSVTIPTSLSLGMSQSGQVYAATTAQIVNNSTGAVTVSGVTFDAANGWTLVPYTTNMANAKVNSKYIGFTVNGEASTVTGSTEAKATAWQIAKGASLPLNYAAVVSATSKAISEQVLTVVFVVGWAS